MTQDKLIREQIAQKVHEAINKKVRNVWFITRTDHNSIIYGVSGNNHVMIAIAEIKENGEIEVIC